MKTIKKNNGLLRRIIRNNKGVSDLVSLVLIVALVAIASISALTVFSNTLKQAFTGIVKTMTGDNSYKMKDESGNIKRDNNMGDVFKQDVKGN